MNTQMDTALLLSAQNNTRNDDDIYEPRQYKTIKDKLPRKKPYEDKFRYFGRIYEEEENPLKGHYLSVPIVLLLMRSQDGIPASYNR